MWSVSAGTVESCFAASYPLGQTCRRAPPRELTPLFMNKALLLVVLLATTNGTVRCEGLQDPVVAGRQVQTIRGTVVDQDTRVPLIGASVTIVDSDPLLGTATDADGAFELRRVPLGRHTLQFSYLGYVTEQVPNVLVSSGQETVLRVTLTEQVVQGAEVVVSAEPVHGRAIDDLATVSGRSFSVEESRRFAGAVDDPARLVASFAGVATSGSGVQDNAVSIRGNSPKGVAWRLEGVPIPTPSHFAGLSVAGGGGLTLFSGRLLADSDVFTGAFPAEYGNAISGVFDMRFRNGNPSTREHTLQVGAIGVEVASEGPFLIGSPATYLFNYRYSTLGLIMPLLPTEGGINYQDLAFKLSFPTKRSGRFELWGLGGLDTQLLVENADSTEWEYDFWDRTRYDLDILVGAAGVSHHLILGKRTYLKTTAAATARRIRWDQDRLDDTVALQPELDLRNTSGRAILSVVANHKFSSRHVIRTGATFQRLFYDLDLQSAVDHVPPPVPVADGSGSAELIELFSQSRYALSPRLSASAGLHTQHLSLTRATSIEPRVGLTWSMTPRQTLTLGYGLHSQAEPVRVYLARPDGVETPNRGLSFTRAHHFVIGVGTQLGNGARAQLEAYAQRLFDVPVVADSTFSMLNFRQDWTFAAPLVNEGKGENVGVELTLERPLRNGFYALASASLFRSRYRDGRGDWHPTRFDQRFALNVIAGREYNVGENNLLGINLRIASVGGERSSPVDVSASMLAREVVFDERSPFADRRDAIWLLDATVTYRMNRRRLSHVVALQLKNALATKDTVHDYNLRSNVVEEVREGFPLPVLGYTIEF